MQAIELETTIGQDGTLHLPERYKFSFGAKARVIVLLKDSVEVSPSASWESQVMRYAGCLDDDFPNEIADADIGKNIAREMMEPETHADKGQADKLMEFAGKLDWPVADPVAFQRECRDEWDREWE